jgi:hypothetical protein
MAGSSTRSRRGGKRSCTAAAGGRDIYAGCEERAHSSAPWWTSSLDADAGGALRDCEVRPRSEVGRSRDLDAFEALVPDRKLRSSHGKA